MVLRRASPALLAPWLAALLLAVLHGADAVKLKFRYEECLTHEFKAYEPFYGSFVAMPDFHGVQAKYDVSIQAPSGSMVYQVIGESDGKFNLITYETGRYKFCLKLNQDRTVSRYVLARDVMWDLHIGNPVMHDGANEQETKELWKHVSDVDGQLQQIRATQQYLYWRERRHRQTVESTNSRVLWFAVFRASALVVCSVGQVILIRMMFVK